MPTTNTDRTLIYRDDRFDGPELAAALLCLLFCCLVSYFPRALLASVAKNIRRSTIALDATTRRLSITKTYFGMISSVVLDSPVEECTACGLIEGRTVRTLDYIVRAGV